jgi:hypothetical protein
MAVRIQIRRDSSSNWTTNNPLLYPGEIGVETDTLKMKIGPAVNSPAVGTAWNSITSYVNTVPSDLNTTLNGYLEVTDLNDTVAALNGVQNLLIPNDSIIFEGATDDAHELTLVAPDVTSDKTVTLPNATTTLVGTDTTDTLTNKTITSPIVSGLTLSDASIVFEGAVADSYETTLTVGEPTEDRTITLPNATDTLVGRATTDTLTNKTLTSPVISGLTISDASIVVEGATANDFETTLAFTDPTADRTITFPDASGTVAFASEITNFITASSTDTLTNKTLTSPVVSGLQLSDGSIVVEGATANDFETTVVFTDPTADRTITFQDVTGTVALLADISAATGGSVTETAVQTLTNKTLTSPLISGLTITDGSIIVEGATADSHETTLAFTDPTEDRTITFPNASGTVAFTSDLSAYAPLSGATFTGAVSGTDLTLSGNLTVNGTTTNINSTDLVVEDKNIVIGDTATPSDATADGGGITLKGTTDKTFNWVDATDAWTSSEHVNLASGKSLYLNGTLLKDATETLSNKTLTSPKINEDVSVTSTATELNILDGATLSTVELNYVDGVTSAIQTQLDDKSTASKTETLTNKTLTSPKINEDVAITATSTEINYTDGVTSAIQTQLDNRVNIADPAVDYYITNSGSGAYLVNGVSNGNIYFEKGKKYRIHVNASGHPFWIQTSSGAYNSGNVYSTGITNNGTENGHILVELASNAPQLYYACQYHSSMAGSIVTGTTFATYKALANLSSVDNTSDADKPVSSATQTALDLKVDESLFDAKGDLLVASADNTPAKLTVGTNGYLLTANSEATNGVEWAAAPVSLPSQSGNSGKYLTTDGTSASWGTLVVPIVTGTDTVTGNTIETVDTTALSAFTSIEYMVSLKQATNNKTRTSKVLVQTDGTSVDMTEFAITETGGTIAGVVVSAAVSSTNAVLQVTVTDAATNNVTVKFSKVSL